MSVRSWSNKIQTGHHLKNDTHGKHIDKKVVFKITKILILLLFS